MKSVTVRVPMRADLAGGTLDLWPIYLFHPSARTVNVAVSYFAECEVQTTGRDAIDVHLTDQGHQRSYASIRELLSDDRMALIARAVEHYGLSGLQIVTRTDAPRGSGLGGSSALAIALVRALGEIAGEPVEDEELIDLVRDLETRVLGIPAGIQDYHPPVFGGLVSIRLVPGRPVRFPIRLPLPELARHMILHYSGVSHFSGTNNWEIYRRQIEGDDRVRAGLSRIAEAAVAMEHALETHDFEAAGRALSEEWTARRELVDGISTPEIDAAITAARKAGSWGAKVCGAGGGGCIVFLCPDEKRYAVIEALRSAPGTTLPAQPTHAALEIEIAGARQISLFGERRAQPAEEEPLKQFFVVHHRRSAYRPWILTEAEVTFDSPRAGFRVTVPKSILAPIDGERGTADWSLSIEENLDNLVSSNQPDPRRSVTSPGDEVIASAVAESQGSLRTWISETERLTLLENAEFELFSEPHESKTAFFSRCVEVANARIDQEKKNLEGTFRRLMDQMRERQEKEERDQDDDDPDQTNSEVTIPWGQLLYNITSGRELGSIPGSAREGDYLHRIGDIQKLWARTVDEIRQGLLDKARAIEPVVLTPEPRRIEILRQFIVWIAGPPRPGRREERDVK